MRRAILCLTAALFCLSSTLPASAGGPIVSPPRRSDDNNSVWDFRKHHFLDLFKELGAPPQMLDFLSSDQSAETDTLVWPIPTKDMNGDGRDDVFELHVTFSFGLEDSQDPLTVREHVETLLIVRSGADGHQLWRKHWDDFIYPYAMRVGEEGKNGVLTLGGWYPFQSVAVEGIPFYLETLKGIDGHRIWLREFQATHAGNYQASVDENLPITLDIFQGVAGQADDIVMGVATVTSVMFEDLIVATRSVVVDGRDGSEAVHPLIDVGVAWIPYPNGVGDLDADGLDDYVLANNIGVDPGDGQETPSVGGTLYARRSTDGSAIWTASGMAFRDFVVTGELPNVTGGSGPEVFLFTPEDPTPLIPIDNSNPLLPQAYVYDRFLLFLFDGDTGVQRWVQYADGIWSPGDVDGDGVSDIALGEGSDNAESLEVTYKRWTVTGENSLIWKRRIRWSLDGVPCPAGGCFFSAWWGSSTVGDVQPDGPREDLVYTAAYQEPNLAEEARNYLLDARTGRTILRGGAELHSVTGSFDDKGADLLDLRVDSGGVHLKGLDGRDGSMLWGLGFQIPGDFLGRRVRVYGDGMDATRDACRDVFLEIQVPDANSSVTYYAILDGGGGKVLWSKWFGPRGRAPQPVARYDGNSTC